MSTTTARRTNTNAKAVPAKAAQAPKPGPKPAAAPKVEAAKAETTESSEKDFAELAKKPATDLHIRFTAWLERETGITGLDVKTVQLACIFRHDFQASAENQDALEAQRKATEEAKAAKAKNAAARATKAIAALPASDLERLLAEAKKAEAAAKKTA